MKKYALVTGGSRGIGRAIAIRLATQGYYVIVNYQSNDAAAQQTLDLIRQAGSDGELMKVDVSNRLAFEQALSQWQQSHEDEYIEVLVNNAGIRRDNLLVWMEPDEFEQVLATNLGSFYNVTRPLLTPMIRHKYGRIINVASLSGIIGLPGQCNYAAAKGGLIAATKALAQEVGRKNITVNAVAPGFVKTEMVEGLDESELKKNIPLNRFAEADEVAALVAFLASKDAGYITGECISINGGLYT
ncbi:MAG: 3-oxoacyl-ACP reductase FabG [Paludibacteraceae bacterium]|nr:3-oxoacyl-ACP reductase FabG [Paludibacteraceae bacterium]